MTVRIQHLLLVGALFLACGARPTRAQARPAASGPGSNVSVGLAYSAFRNPYGQRDLGGRAAVVDVNPTWRYGLELEGRTLIDNRDEGVTLANYFAGLRVAALPGRLSPYGKFLVGAGRINFPFAYAKGTYFAFVPGGGVDYHLTDRIALRADGEYQMWQDFTYGSFRPYGVSIGLNFRINGIDRAPRHAYYSRIH